MFIFPPPPFLPVPLPSPSLYKRHCNTFLLFYIPRLQLWGSLHWWDFCVCEFLATKFMQSHSDHWPEIKGEKSFCKYRPDCRSWSRIHGFHTGQLHHLGSPELPVPRFGLVLSKGYLLSDCMKIEIWMLTRKQTNLNNTQSNASQIQCELCNQESNKVWTHCERIGQLSYAVKWFRIV